MKFWKKAIATALSAGMFFSVAGCFEQETPPPTAEQCAAALTQTLNGVNTLQGSVTLVAESTVSQEGMKVKSTSTTTVDILIAKTQTGADMKLTAETTMLQDMGGMSLTQTESSTAYLIDGYFYEEVDGVWEKSETPVWSAEETGIDLSQLQNAFQPLGEEELSQLQSALTELISSNCTVTGNSFFYTADFTPQATTLINFFKEIDPATDTLGGLINEALGKIQPDLTVESLLDTLVLFGEKTVEDLYKSLDESVQAEYGATLQQLKDSLLANPSVLALLKDKLGIAETEIETWKAAQLADLLEPYKTLTVNDLLAMLVQSFEEDSNGADGENGGSENGNEDGIVQTEVTTNPEGEETQTITQQFATKAKAILSTPIQDLFGEDAETAQTVFSLLSSLQISKLQSKWEVSFDKALAVKGVSFTTEAALSFSLEGAPISTATTLTFTLHSFSKESTKITLPN